MIKYEENIKGLTEAVNVDEVSNACLDSNGRQVCSSYRFTIRSDMPRDVTATLNNESNGFAYLSYALYDVTNDKWVELTDDKQLDLPLKGCSNTIEEIDNCFTMEETIKTYTDTATNSIFGMTTVDSLPVKKSVRVTGTTQVYDLVLFIKENNANQNADQGKQYSGTIIVDVYEGGLNGTITGCVGDDCKQ